MSKWYYATSTGICFSSEVFDVFDALNLYFKTFCGSLVILMYPSDCSSCEANIWRSCLVSFYLMEILFCSALKYLLYCLRTSVIYEKSEIWQIYIYLEWLNTFPDKLCNWVSTSGWFVSVTRSATIEKCRNTTVVLGPVETVVHISNCENLTVIAPCHTVIVR